MVTIEEQCIAVNTRRKYTCQVSRLKRDCHACGSKTWISRLLTPVLRFVTPGGKVWAITALTDTIIRMHVLGYDIFGGWGGMT